MTREPPARDQHAAWRGAESLESADVGEILVLDDSGRVLGQRARRWLAVRNVGSIVGTSALAGGLGALIVHPIAGGVIGAGTLAVTLWQMRHGPAIRRALALASAGERDEALALVTAIERKRPAGHHRPVLDQLAGKLAWQSGRTDEALARYTRAIDAYEATKGHRKEGLYWICCFERVQLLAAMGRLDRALALRPGLDEAPGGDYFAMERILTDLSLAFHTNTTKRLPGDEILYEWAKTAVRTNRFAVVLALAAWVFENKRDPDMRDQLLEQVRARMSAEIYFEETTPRLAAWYREAVTGLEDEP